MAEPEHSSGVGRLWSDGLGSAATRAIQLLALIALVSVLVFGLLRVTVIVIPVLISLILASAAAPMITGLKKRGIPDILATVIVFVGTIAIFGTIIWFIVRSVENQWGELSSSVVEGIDALQGLIARLPIQIGSEQIDKWVDMATDMLTSGSLGSTALSGLSAVGNFGTGLALTLVVSFFFMKDGSNIWKFLLSWVKLPHRGRVDSAGRAAVKIFGGYIRGTSIVAAVDATFIGIGLAILGVPLALPLAILVFIGAFIPIVGAVLVGVVAALVALVTNGPIAALVVIIIVIVVNQLEGNLLQPVVMGNTLSLHAMVVLLALTAGSVLSGIIGAILAVPLTAAIWAVIKVWSGRVTPEDDEPDEPNVIQRWIERIKDARAERQAERAAEQEAAVAAGEEDVSGGADRSE